MWPQELPHPYVGAWIGQSHTAHSVFIYLFLRKALTLGPRLSPFFSLPGQVSWTTWRQMLCTGFHGKVWTSALPPSFREKTGSSGTVPVRMRRRAEAI